MRLYNASIKQIEESAAKEEEFFSLKTVWFVLKWTIISMIVLILSGAIR